MKRLPIISIMLPSIFLVATAMSSISPQVQTAFKKKYPKQTSVWWHEDKDGNNIARFNSKDGEKEAMFKPDGTWLKTTTDIDQENLPNCIIKYLDTNTKYDGLELFSAEIYEDPNIKKVYLVILKQSEEYDFEEEDKVSEDSMETEEAYDPGYLVVSFDGCKFIKHELTYL